MSKQDILDFFSDINHAYNDSTRLVTLNRMLDELIEDASSTWHRVEEPPKDGLYGKLVCDTEGQISVCRGYATVKLQNGSVVYTDSRLLDIFKEETDKWNWEDITHFTHWMPIPEPPMEDA